MAYVRQIDEIFIILMGNPPMFGEGGQFLGSEFTHARAATRRVRLCSEMSAAGFATTTSLLI